LTLSVKGGFIIPVNTTTPREAHDMTRITLNTIQQEHIADLIIEHRLTASSEDRYFQRWLETDDETAHNLFKAQARHRRHIEAELLDRYNINLEAATTRRLNKAFNTAA
jgi:hypothetical protein